MIYDEGRFAAIFFECFARECQHKPAKSKQIIGFRQSNGRGNFLQCRGADVDPAIR